MMPVCILLIIFAISPLLSALDYKSSIEDYRSAVAKAVDIQTANCFNDMKEQLGKGTEPIVLTYQE